AASFNARAERRTAVGRGIASCRLGTRVGAPIPKTSISTSAPRRPWMSRSRSRTPAIKRRCVARPTRSPTPRHLHRPRPWSREPQPQVVRLTAVASRCSPRRLLPRCRFSFLLLPARGGARRLLRLPHEEQGSVPHVSGVDEEEIPFIPSVARRLRAQSGGG